jgi:predicted LPLAT superfamily acyltransferase
VSIAVPAEPQVLHWSRLRERGALAGLQFLAATFRLVGYGGCRRILALVVFYFWLTGHRQRAASRQFLERALGRSATWRDTLAHFQSFGRRSLDVVAGWMGHDVGAFDFANAPELEAAKSGQRGLLLVVSHLGNIEVLRARLDAEFRSRLTVLVHTRHATFFNDMLRRLSPEAALNTVEVSELGPETLVLLQERIEAGDWVAIAGDRTPVTGNRRQSIVPFLGHDALFPQGPYLLAALLGCPLYALFCLQDVGPSPGTSRRMVYFERLASRIDLPPGPGKEGVLRDCAARYASRLERLARTHPFQWYNFFDIWRQ